MKIEVLVDGETVDQLLLLGHVTFTMAVTHN